MAAKKRSNDRINAILDGFTEEDFGMGDFSQLQSAGLKVEYLPIQLVYPDPAQPRRVLPSSIYQAFYAERYTPAQALKEFIRLVQVTARQKGRPFSSVEELLPNPDDEQETDLGKLTPEETLLRDLVTLAMTIRDDGQVNPLTVVDRSQGVTRLYRIETGERRYWATWIMIEFLSGYQGDGTLPCIIVPHDQASVFRQAKENTARSSLNAIGLARQAALLILAVHDIHPPEGAVSNDFYRQALDLDLRSKREYTTDIMAAMGGISRVHFSRFKNLLRLSDEALELADRHAIDEYKLRPILTIHEDHHAEVVRQVIDFNLTSKQVRDLCESSDEEVPVEEPYKPAKHAIKLARSILKNDDSEAREVVHALLNEERDPRIIKLRWDEFNQVINTYLESL